MTYATSTGRDATVTSDVEVAEPTTAPADAAHFLARALPEGHRTYAIGDIHGRMDLLTDLLKRIAADDAALATVPHKGLVFLGDFVDRGPDSAGVVDLVSSDPLPGFTTIALMGNHERLMLDFMADPEHAELWLINGGDTTLKSYGIKQWRGKSAELLREALLSAMPDQHREFLANLPLSHVQDPYIFVHAGVRPGVPIAEQKPDDLIWIREPFLRHPQPAEWIVVHGHTPAVEPDDQPHRIGIDTLAYRTGKLTAVRLEGAERAFLHTGG